MLWYTESRRNSNSAHKTRSGCPCHDEDSLAEASPTSARVRYNAVDDFTHGRSPMNLTPSPPPTPVLPYGREAAPGVLGFFSPDPPAAVQLTDPDQIRRKYGR